MDARTPANPLPPGEEIPQPALFRRSLLWWALLGIIFMVGLAVRLYDLGAPPVDFHPTRQLHSALIARGMYYQAGASVPAWRREMAVSQWHTEGVIEPQVFERLAAWSYALAGTADLRIPRLFAIFFWTAAALFVTLIASEITGQGGALLAALFFMAWPYGVIASRAFQPEPLLIALMAAALWAALRWEKRATWGWTVAAGLLVGLAIFIKSVAVFFLGPALAVLVIFKSGWRRAVRDPQVWVLALLSLLPYGLYFIDGVYLRKYLLGQFALRFFPEMWLDPAFYLRWLSNLGRALPFEMALASLLGAFLVRRPAHRAVYLAMWAGYVIYGMTLPHQISTHDYYHLPLYPLVALGLASAAETLFQAVRGPRWLAQTAVILVLAAALVVNGYVARTAIKRSGAWEQARAWEEIGRVTGPGASVVALVDDYGSGLRYYAWVNPTIWPTEADIQFRQSAGQAFDFDSFFQNEAAGKDFFVVAPPQALEEQPRLKELLADRYAIIRQSPGYSVFDLRSPAKR